MRNQQLPTRLAIALLLAASAAWAEAVENASEATARVWRIEGHARWRAADGDWRALSPGATLQVGSIVETDPEPGTLVDLVLCEPGAPLPSFAPSGPDKTSPTTAYVYQPPAEHDVVRLWNSSSLKLEKLACLDPGITAISEIQLELTKGRLTGKAKKLTPGSVYEVKVPLGIVGIRGTLYDISGEGIVQVLEGTVVAAYFDAITGNVVTQFVHAGQMFDLRSALLSYLTNAQRAALEQARRALTLRQAERRAEYAPDRTIEHVSPAKGAGP